MLAALRVSIGRCPRAVIAVCAVFGMAPPAPADSIRGDCRYNGEIVRFVDGVVYREPVLRDGNVDDRFVALAAFAIDRSALAATERKNDEIARQRSVAGNGSLLRLYLFKGRVVWMYSDHAAGFPLVSRSNAGRLQTRVDDAGHLDATFELDGAADELQCRLDFDLAYAPPPPAAGDGEAASAPLPSGRGGPGAVPTFRGARGNGRPPRGEAVAADAVTAPAAPFGQSSVE